MQVKTKVISKKVEIDEVELTLNSEDVYWLLGVIGAQTDEKARVIYNALINSVTTETGDSDRDIRNNPAYSAANKMASNNSIYGNTFEKSLEPKTVTFMYDGQTRQVNDPVFEGDLLKGFELTRGALPTNQFKSYRLDKIGKRAHSILFRS